MVFLSPNSTLAVRMSKKQHVIPTQIYMRISECNIVGHWQLGVQLIYAAVINEGPKIELSAPFGG